MFGLLGKRTNKYGRDPIVMFGYVIHMVCFYLIFLNQPMASPIKDSIGTYITPKYVTTISHVKTCIFIPSH